MLHELSQVLRSFHRHRVVHGHSDARIEKVSSDLNDSCLLCLRNKGFFKLFVSVLDSEDNVDARSVALVSNLRFVVPVGRVYEGPKNF
jgi:hypothetical protein